MPKTQTEEDKKHGDKLQPLIDRTGGNKSATREQGADDPAALQDDDDEDVQNDDVDDRRDVGDPD